MQRYNLRLTPEEMDVLEHTLEAVIAREWFNVPIHKDILTKIVVTKVEAEEPVDYHRVQSESDLAF